MVTRKLRDLAALGILLLISGTLAWLNGRADSDSLRLAFAVAILALAGLLLVKSRESLWRPPAIVAFSGVALVLVFLTSPSVNVPVFEAFMAPAIGAAFVWLLAWLLVRCAFPRARARYQARPLLLLSCALSFALLVLSLGAWLKAVDLHALPQSAVVTTGAELAALSELTWGNRYNGIFAVGRIGEPAKRHAKEGGDYLAYYNAARPLGFSADFARLLPSSYRMRLADGAEIWVAGVDGRRQTADWPTCGPYPFQHCLRQGDPIVIWADPGILRAFGSGEKSHALNETRVIAYGSLEQFRAGYLARTVATARLFGWIALAFVPLSLLPAILGWRRWRWLRLHGSDEPSPITITRA